MSDVARVADEDLDALQPSVGIDGNRVAVTVTGPASARVVANALTLRDLDDLVLLAGHVVDGCVRATDAGGFSLDGDSAVVWDAGDEHVAVSTRALRDLLGRVVSAALAERDRLAGIADEQTWTSLERVAAG